MTKNSRFSLHLVAAAAGTLLALVWLAAAGETAVPEWALLTDEESNLWMDCAGEGGCDGRHVEVPHLRVGGDATTATGHLDIRYDAEDAAFVLNAPNGIGLRVGGIDVAAQKARVAALEAENAALRSTQARIQCALIEGGTEGIGDALKVATVGASDWEHFVIGSEHFLVVANNFHNGSYVQDSVIFLWTGSAFVANQSITTLGAYDWEHFVIGSEHFLVVANSRNGHDFLQDSVVYKRDGGVFVVNQSIPTVGAREWKHFVIATDHYLVVANQRNFTSYQQDSILYKWSGGSFVPHQRIPTIGAMDWEHFEVGSEHFLVVANSYSASVGSGFVQDSVLYKWDGGVFAVNQSISTKGAYEWEYFEIEAEHFLVVANHYDTAGAYQQNSVVYKRVGGVFVVNQSIPTLGAYDWEHFVIGTEHFLAVANYRLNGEYLQNSEIFRWRGGKFVSDQSLATIGAFSLKSFGIGEQRFLAVAYRNNSSTSALAAFLQDSPIFKWNSHCFV